MRKRNFSSIFANELNQYLDYKISLGFKQISYLSILSTFDRFCSSNDLRAPIFTRELADQWIQPRNGEATTTQYSRVNAVKNFLIFLVKQGYNVYVTRDIAHKETQFKPHIYTEDEIKKYFYAVDTIDSVINRKIKVQFPLLFRILFCCGTRINETLSIRKKDVDLDSGILKMIETKNSRERYVILGDDLALMMRQFAVKTFYLLKDDDYIFSSTNDSRYDGKTIYRYHRMILKQAGIPYVGGGEGPRIHDWRYAFAVYAFKRMVDAGIDMYVALPILSTYLGHKSIYATEHYVRLAMSMFPYIEEKFETIAEKVFGGIHNENN